LIANTIIKKLSIFLEVKTASAYITDIKFLAIFLMFFLGVRAAPWMKR